MKGLGLTLRMATRQALRAKARSAMVLLLIALPVLVVTVLAIVTRTADVSPAESVGRNMGAAQARIWFAGQDVEQGSDPWRGMWASDEDQGLSPDLDAATAALGEGARLVQTVWAGQEVRVPREGRPLPVEAREIDLADPLTKGAFTLTSGRAPERDGEVVVNEDLAAKGYALGSMLPLEGGGPAAEVVGVGTDTLVKGVPVVVGRPGTLVPPESLPATGESGASWLVDGPPVTWDQVRALNELGFVVASREVMTNPPTGIDLDEGQSDDATLQLLALITVMVLIEVVLLAGPAFAVGARQHSRTVALVTLNGGTPAQARRVVLAGAAVLGGVATLLGLVLGVAVARALVGPLEGLDDGHVWGPFEVPWAWLLPVAAFGLVSALLAAAVPAWSSARQDVVRVLAGRRGSGDASPRTPLLGLGLLALGVLGTAWSVTVSGADPRAAGAVTVGLAVLVVGMVLVVPALVSLVAKLAARLPVSARFATRDAARHRSRSVPAVAAVAATVAGVVAIGISSSSDLKESRETYEPTLSRGDTALTFGFGSDSDAADRVAAVRAEVGRALPDADVLEVGRLATDDGGSGDVSWAVRLPGEDGEPAYSGYGLGQDVVVADDASLLGLEGDAAERAQQALADGRTVVMSYGSDGAEEAVLVREEWSEEKPSAKYRIPALVLPVRGRPVAVAVVPTARAAEMGVTVEPSALLVTTSLDEDQARTLAGRVEAADPDVFVKTERGYESPPEAALLYLLLAGGGGLLMLAGTLTATALALGDARGDLATLSAVGAAPRTRRLVAGWYALVVAGVGAVLGAAVGFVPGLALARSLTVGYWEPGTPQGPFYEVPWLLVLTVVVGLPLLMALVVTVFSRSRLPMVARID